MGGRSVTGSRWENEHEKPSRSADRRVHLAFAVEASEAVELATLPEKQQREIMTGLENDITEKLKEIRKT